MSKWIYVIWNAVSCLLQFLQFFLDLSVHLWAIIVYLRVMYIYFVLFASITCEKRGTSVISIALVSDLISLCLPGCWKLMTQRSQRVRWTRTFTALWSSIVPHTALSLSSFKFYYSVWREYWAHCWCQITFLIYRRWLFNTLLSRSEEKYIWNVLCSVCSWCIILKSIALCFLNWCF